MAMRKLNDIWRGLSRFLADHRTSVLRLASRALPISLAVDSMRSAGTARLVAAQPSHERLLRMEQKAPTRTSEDAPWE